MYVYTLYTNMHLSNYLCKAICLKCSAKESMGTHFDSNKTPSHTLFMATMRIALASLPIRSSRKSLRAQVIRKRCLDEASRHHSAGLSQISQSLWMTVNLCCDLDRTVVSCCKTCKTRLCSWSTWDLLPSQF